MNEHRATEVAFKNGYEQGVRDVLKELETRAPWFCENQTAYEHFNEELAVLKQKYGEGKDD